MSGPPIPYSNPPPVALVTPSNLGAETALQYSNGEYYFALSVDPSGASTFNGPVVIEGPGAALQIIDSGDNTAAAISAPGIGRGSLFLNSSAVDANTNSIGIQGGSAAPGDFNISSIGAVSPGNILNYNPTGSLVQLGNAAGQVQVLGAAGVGQVYDEVNNPIILNTNITTIATYSGAFSTITDVGYVAPRTGFFLVSTTLTVGGVGVTWGTPNGSANLNVGLTLTQGSLVFVNNSVVSFYGLEEGPLVDTKQILVFLTGGVTYFNDFQAVGTPNAGTTGGLVVRIQPFA
jgi:hypothetical protein